MIFETQEELLDHANAKSREVFPPGENYSSVYIPRNTKRYFYFPWIDYFRKHSITPDMVNKLRSGGNMLSVGCGDCNLERLLACGFDIPKDQIVVSDIELDPSVKQLGFHFYEFDMTGRWPETDERFDYIIFPQSLGVAVTALHLPGEARTHRFYLEVESDTKRILEGEVPEHPELLKDLIEMDAPQICKKYEIINKAINYLKPVGEIRVFYGITEDQEKAYTMLKLKSEINGITFPQPYNHEDFFIKVGE